MIRNEKGFTLIELMVVVLIIGILVAIAIPVFGSAATNAKLRSCQANLRTLDGGIAQYNAEYNSNPADPAALVTAGFVKVNPDCPHTNAADYTMATVSGNYMARCSQGAGHDY